MEVSFSSSLPASDHLLITWTVLARSGGSTGAMIPYIERNYNISYARVSVLFVSTFIGYVTSAAATGPLIRRVGFGKTLLMSLVVELIGVIMFPTLSLPP